MTLKERMLRTVNPDIGLEEHHHLINMSPVKERCGFFVLFCPVSLVPQYFFSNPVGFGPVPSVVSKISAYSTFNDLRMNLNKQVFLYR